MPKEEVPPLPTLFGFGRYRNRYGKKMDKEEEEEEEMAPPQPPPPPPPPAPLGFKGCRNKCSAKMIKEKVSPPPRTLGFKGCRNQCSAKMDQEEVSQVPPSPPPLGCRRYHNQNGNKMDKEIVPPSARRFKRSRNQRSKNMDKEVPSTTPAPRPRRFKRHQNQNGKEMDEKIALPASHHFPTENPRCPVSHPTHPHTLSPRFGGNTKFGCFSCGENTSPMTEDQNYHFFCTTCDVEFHGGHCLRFPRKLTHPYHLQHPLTFTFRNDETRIISDGIIDESFCTTVFSDSNTSDPKKLGSTKSDHCTWCGKSIQGIWSYRCSI